MHGLMDLTHLLPSNFSLSIPSCFTEDKGSWRAKLPLEEEGLSVVYTYDGETMRADVLDEEGEKISLFYLSNPGPFASKIRDEVEKLLSSLVLPPFSSDSDYREKVFSLLRNRYGIEGEVPWSDDDTSIVFRSPKNRKWIGIMMNISSNKLDIPGEEKIDVINLKHSQSDIPSLIDHRFIFPAWHMNKKTWITVLLSSDMDWEVFSSLVEESRRLVE